MKRAKTEKAQRRKKKMMTKRRKAKREWSGKVRKNTLHGKSQDHNEKKQEEKKYSSSKIRSRR